MKTYSDEDVCTENGRGDDHHMVEESDVEGSSCSGDAQDRDDLSSGRVDGACHKRVVDEEAKQGSKTETHDDNSDLGPLGGSIAHTETHSKANTANKRDGPGGRKVREHEDIDREELDEHHSESREECQGDASEATTNEAEISTQNDHWNSNPVAVVIESFGERS